MGTPDFALTSLKKLCDGEHNVCAVVCQPDKPKGRGQKLEKCPSKQWAEENQITVLQPERCKDCGFVEQVKEMAPDLIVVASFGQILPNDLLAIPRFGSINVHSSLLPKYRGASPIAAAILNGDAETGVTIMRVVQKLDAGPILLQRKVPVERDDTAGALHDKLAELGAELLGEAIELIKAGKITETAQDESKMVYAPMLKKEQGRVDWKEPAEIISRKVRAFNPWPGAFVGEGENLIKIWKAVPATEKGTPGIILEAHKKWIEVACGVGSLRILLLQPAGKKIMSPEAFLAGRKIQVGSQFGVRA
jgi:methionyl-tRNA formyltransferase